MWCHVYCKCVLFLVSFPACGRIHGIVSPCKHFVFLQRGLRRSCAGLCCTAASVSFQLRVAWPLFQSDCPIQFIHPRLFFSRPILSTPSLLPSLPHSSLTIGLLSQNDAPTPRAARPGPPPKVVHPSGVSLRNEPCTGADRTVHVLGYGEVFVACERQWVSRIKGMGSVGQTA